MEGEGIERERERVGIETRERSSAAVVKSVRTNHGFVVDSRYGIQPVLEKPGKDNHKKIEATHSN